jgi:hypothetical protein
LVTAKDVQGQKAVIAVVPVVKGAHLLAVDPIKRWGRVEIWRGGPRGSVSRSRSSNRTCGFPVIRLSDKG